MLQGSKPGRDSAQRELTRILGSFAAGSLGLGPKNGKQACQLNWNAGLQSRVPTARSDSDTARRPAFASLGGGGWR